MSLRLKVLLATSIAIATSLATLGLVAINAYRTVSSDALAARLGDTIAQISESEKSPLQAAVYVSSFSNFPLLVALADSTGEVTSLSENELGIGTITRSTLVQAVQQPVELRSAEVLIRTIPSANKEFVIIATSLAEIEATSSSLTGNLFVAVILLSLMGALLVFVLTRGDLRKIHQLSKEANAVRLGSREAEVTAHKGKSEVAALSQAVAGMTEALVANATEMQSLLGSISHEIKTPLTSIKGYVELMAEGELDEQSQLRYLDIIAAEVDRVTALTNDLLLISKMGTIQYSLDDLVEIGELVQQRFRVLCDLQPERAVTIDVEPGLMVRGSRMLLSRLVDNLVSNALNHTPASASVRLIARTTSRGWTFTYSDAGPGLPASFMSEGQVEFRRFDARKEGSSGTGLGLHIIESITEQHHGTLTVSSRPSGLTLSFDFPRLP